MADNIELHFQGKRSQWEAMYTTALNSDFAAVQIGIFVMKALITVNGAALVAVLAAFPQLQDVPSFKGAVVTVGLLFVGGIAAGLLGAIIAYFYQSTVTANAWHEMHVKFPTESNLPPFPWASKTAVYLAFPMLGFNLLSFVLFCFGSWYLLEAFSPRCSVG